MADVFGNYHIEIFWAGDKNVGIEPYGANMVDT